MYTSEFFNPLQDQFDPFSNFAKATHGIFTPSKQRDAFQVAPQMDITPNGIVALFSDPIQLIKIDASGNETNRITLGGYTDE